MSFRQHRGGQYVIGIRLGKRRKLFYDIYDASAQTGISVPTIYHLIRNGSARDGWCFDYELPVNEKGFLK